MSQDEKLDTENRQATAEEIRDWEEEHDEPHPVFQVSHRPERLSGDDFWETRPSEEMTDVE